MVAIRNALLATGLASAVLAAPTTLEERQQTCHSGVYIISARGTLESPDQGSPGSAANVVISQIPDSVLVNVSYPALLAPYQDSVNAGINDVLSKIHSYVDTCGPSSKIVLLGYSQGAQVMSDTLAGGANLIAPLEERYRPNIRAVVGWGDTTWVVNQTYDAGTADNTNVRSIYSRSGASLVRLNTYSRVIRSYCDMGDPICASQNGDAHGHYFPKYDQDAAMFIGGLSR